jgi:carbon storage regulator CsrA
MRTLGETLRIGDEIVVTVADIRSDARQVRIGIEAPPAVKVLRSELVESPVSTTKCRLSSES